MRFASIGGQSNYAQAGKAVANDASKIFKAARRNSVDFDGLAQSAMKNKSNENIAQTKADLHVKKAEFKEEGRKQKMEVAKAGVMRKAGVLAATGIAGLAEKADKSDYSLYDKKIAGLKAKNDADRVTMEGIDTSGKKVETSANTGGTGTSSSTGGGLVSSGQALEAGKGSAGAGGKYDLTAMTNYAIQGGFSPENARTMAAISMGESGGNAGIDTVQSGLDPNQTNEFSVGLAQINVQAHGAKLSRRGWTQEDLRDPVKNMTIAKEVYDEVGSFKPWSVYQKGLHNQYL